MMREMRLLASLQHINIVHPVGARMSPYPAILFPNFGKGHSLDGWINDVRTAQNLRPFSPVRARVTSVVPAWRLTSRPAVLLLRLALE